MLSLSVDAMGGDHAPGEIVAGAVRFVREGGVEADDVRLLLVGDPEAVRAELARHGALDDPRLTPYPASEVIAMHDHPMEALRRKPDASLVVAARLVRDGEAAATVSAGNTGACMIAAIQLIGRLSGINRPAIATAIPTEDGGVALVVDAGANVDCRPSHLVQFALMGSVYAQKVLGIDAPRVGLLSNGEEESKGNELVKETRPLLADAPIRFVGAIEGNHVTEGAADVVVCDGFAGNVLLKAVEGMARLSLKVLAAEAQASPGDASLARALDVLRRRVDYSEYGGAPLLGIAGVSIIAHGRSDAKAIASAIRIAAQAARADYVAGVADAIQAMKA